MSAQTNNYLSLLYCFNKNGQYVKFPLFQDLQVGQIISARLQTLPDVNGNPVSAFLITAQNAKSLTEDVFWVQTKNFLSTLVQLQTQLQSINAGNSFTLYSGLLECPVPSRVLSDYLGYILMNDPMVVKRFYNLYEQATYLTIRSANELIDTQVKVSGDQTTSGTYYYAYYL